MSDEHFLDLDQVVEFYDPHSGERFHGAMAAPPHAIMEVVRELTGETMPLGCALDKLRALGIGYIEVYKDCIMLNTHRSEDLADPNRRVLAHGWRLLRFR